MTFPIGKSSMIKYWSESNISLKNKVEICFENWNKEKLSQIALLVLLVTTQYTCVELQSFW